ncbi:MAG: alpha/beta fold hydrolase [Gaiellaceae bacterium]
MARDLAGARGRPGRKPALRLNEHRWGSPDAPLVVCLHGVCAHGLRFRRLAEEHLAPRFQVRALDLRGHGRSGWSEPWTIAQHVDDVLETVTEPAIWIGHSFGGRLTVGVTARRPDLVERAVLLDPALWVPPDMAEGIARSELAKAPYASVEEAVQARAASVEHAPPQFLEEELREHLVEQPDGGWSFRYSTEAVAAAYREMATLPPTWESLCVPTLLVVAEHAKLVSAAELELYRAALGDLLQVAVVPGGHIVLWDAYEETAAAIDSFLAA